jgi:GGDEF domain-containing protein
MMPRRRDTTGQAGPTTTGQAGHARPVDLTPASEHRAGAAPPGYGGSPFQDVRRGPILSETLASQLLLQQAVADAQRQLLQLSRPTDAARVLITFVESLGGEVVPAHTSGPDVIPVDLTFGFADAVVPAAPRGSQVRAQLEATLPRLVQDASRLVGLLSAVADQVDLDTTDLLTRLPSLDRFRRIVDRAVAGDVVVALTIDDAGTVTATHGRARWDAQMQLAADLIRSQLRAGDHAGRIGEASFGLLLIRTSPADAQAIADRIVRAWEHDRSVTVRLRSTVVAVQEDGGGVTLELLRQRLGLGSASRQVTS